MSKMRMVDTRFWNDTFVVDNLNPLDRYLFLYFLTNSKTNISGVYELPLKLIANETGIEKEELSRMMDRLKPKIEYKNGWVCIVNFLNYQRVGNKFIKTGIEAELNNIPDNVRVWVGHLRSPQVTCSPPEDINLNLNSNLNLNTKINPARSKSKKIIEFNPLGAEVIKLFEEVDPKNKKLYSNKTQRRACDFLLEEYGFDQIQKRVSVLSKTNKIPYFPTITTPLELQDKWVKLEEAVSRTRNKTTNSGKGIA